MKSEYVLTVVITAVVTALSGSLVIFFSPLQLVFSDNLQKVEFINTEIGKTTMDWNTSNNEINAIKINESDLQEFGIEISTAAPGNLLIQTDLTGEIVINPEQLAHVIPRFPGIVKEIRKRIGDSVKKGEVLAIIESNESLVPYELTSLIDGMVLEMHLTLGEVFQDESHAFLIANLENVWVNLSVYQKDLPYIHLEQPVTISAGLGMPEKTGNISYISPIVDEITRTATARVILPNDDGIWRPGLFVSGRVSTQSISVPILVPKTALETIDNDIHVFIKTINGFLPTKVTIGRSNRTHVEIISGLAAGQEYVSKGGFTLKAEMSKSDFGDDNH